VNDIKMGNVFVVPTPIDAGGLFVNVGLASQANVAVFSTLLILFSLTVVAEALLHIPYSKFAKEDALKEMPIGGLKSVFNKQLSGRTAFFICYLAPLLSYIIMWGSFARQNMSAIGLVAPSPGYSIALFVFWLLAFGKRCFEVLFIHIFSGNMPVMSCFLISLAYSLAGLACCFFSNQVVGYELFGQETKAKDVISFILFFVGISVNGLAHYQLRLVRLKQMDETSNKRYYSPDEIGVLFRVLICPHYVFEITVFAGMCLLGATSVHYVTFFTVLLYLGSRIRATREWYKKKGLLGKRNSQKSSLLSSTANPQFDHQLASTSNV